jgi:hypothetical protein
MTDAEAKKLADDWNALDKDMRRHRSSLCPDQYDIQKCEARMARIEAKFRQADRDIRDWY